MKFNFSGDKSKHFFAGLGIGLLASLLGPLWAIGATALAGAGKEAWDALGHGEPDWMDWLVTVMGGVAAVVINRLVVALWF